jgi:hypothetical protein
VSGVFLVLAFIAADSMALTKSVPLTGEDSQCLTLLVVKCGWTFFLVDPVFFERDLGLYINSSKICYSCSTTIILSD